MSKLSKYITPITIAGEFLGGSYQAYKMDSTEPQLNLRKDVRLGTCNCCDYFQIQDEKILLIEETDLIRTYIDLNHDYSKLPSAQLEKLIDKLIHAENRSKVYGSMLVLCRLATKYECVASLLNDKQIVFFLVVSKIEDEDTKFFEYLNNKILFDLKSMLSREIVSDVQILSPEMLKGKL